jgi:hypothetical protein
LFDCASTVKQGSGAFFCWALPLLRAELGREQQQHWQLWQIQSQRLRCDANRLAIQRQLLELGMPAAAERSPTQ